MIYCTHSDSSVSYVKSIDVSLCEFTPEVNGKLPNVVMGDFGKDKKNDDIIGPVYQAV